MCVYFLCQADCIPLHPLHYCWGVCNTTVCWQYTRSLTSFFAEQSPEHFIVLHPIFDWFCLKVASFPCWVSSFFFFYSCCFVSPKSISFVPSFTHVDVPNSGSRVSLCFCKFLPHTGDDQQQLLNANGELSAESLSLMCLMKGISLFNCPHCMDKGIMFGGGRIIMSEYF